MTDDEQPVGQLVVGEGGLDPVRHGGPGARPAAPRHTDPGVFEVGDVEAIGGKCGCQRRQVVAVVLLAPETSVHERNGQPRGARSAGGSHTS